MRGRTPSLIWWLLPVAFLLWLYREAFSTWFVADDFAWLSLLRIVHRRHDLLHELFSPMAQGTIRPWSERGYFLLLESLFGLDAAPFRVTAFATAVGDLFLIGWIARRISGSRIAGVVAAILWTANTALVRPLTWSSAYNELLCPLCLMGALVLFIRSLDTGRRIFWWWQLVVFGLGFGVLEINIVYPALAAAWVLTQCAPDRRISGLRAIVPQSAMSVVYYLIHRIAAPMPASGPYRLTFDASIFKTLALYLKWAVSPEPMMRLGYSHRSVVIVVAAGLLGLAAFSFRNRRIAGFGIAWFLITLAPVLPLAFHRSDYYITIPFIGLAIVGGAAAAMMWNGSWLCRAATLTPILIYLGAMIPASEAATHIWNARSQPVRVLVLGAQAARASHPGKAIVIEGVTTDLYNLSLADQPFLAAGVDDVYLTPESALNIHPDHGQTDLDSLVLEPIVLRRAIEHNDAVVYSLESDRLRNITERYRRRPESPGAGPLMDRLPNRIDVGNFLYSWLLGPTWLSPETGIRWMPGSATVRIGTPVEVHAGGSVRLELEGHFPEAQLRAGSRHLKVLIDGTLVGETRIYDPETTFRRLYRVPADVMAGKDSVEIEIRVDPVDRKDGQDYGVVFGKFALQPNGL